MAQPRQRPSIPARFQFNLYPVTFTSQVARVLVGPWIDQETADTLRQSFPGLNTWRDSDDGSRLLAWYSDKDLESVTAPEEFRVAEFTSTEHAMLFKHLLQVGLHSRMSTLGYASNGFNRFNHPGINILPSIPALSAASGDQIRLFTEICADTFITKSNVGTQIWAIGVDFSFSTKSAVTVEEWIAAGLGDSLIGLYVNLLPTGPLARDFPALVDKVVGRIAGLRDGTVELEDTRIPTLAVMAAHCAELAPEPTQSNVDRYLEARCREAFLPGKRALVQKLRNAARPGKRQQWIQKMVDKCFGMPLNLLPALSATVSSALFSTPDAFPVRQLPPPVFSFDPANVRIHDRIDFGLKEFGPWDQERMQNQPCDILVVGPRRLQGVIETLCHKMEHGVGKGSIFAGMRRTYRLARLRFTKALVDVNERVPMLGYAETLSKSLRGATNKYSLVVTVLEDTWKSLPDSENPYYQSKGLVLALDGIPTQVVTREKLLSKDADLEWILSTAALACYAKIGGTPFVLRMDGDRAERASQHRPVELVFGIGRAFTREDRFSPAKETVGFTTVFRANGEYVYNDSTPYCDGDSYTRALEETILRTIDNVAAFEALPSGAELRLIFHLPRRSGKEEVRAVINAVNKVPRFKVSFALLHVNDDHRIHIFDTFAESPIVKRKQRPEAALIPPRGTCIHLGPRERLLTLIGPEQYRGYGAPTALRLTLDKASTFSDLEYLSQQVYWFAHMSAASYTPGRLPVTINYAERLAEITGHLRSVQEWAVELIQTKLGHKLWFI